MTFRNLLVAFGLGRVAGRLFFLLAGSGLTGGILARAVAARLAGRVVPFARGGTSVPGRLFALSKVRIAPDAEVLARAGFDIVTLPDSDQFVLQAAFFPGLPPETAAIDIATRRDAAPYRAFLRRLLPIFLRRIGAQAVIGAHFMYPQDIHWGAVAQECGYPYLILFRESLKISDTERDALTDMCRRLGRFEGDRILTWNDVARDVIVASGYARADQVVTTGAVRLSAFIAKCRTRPLPHPPGTKPTATLFSFNPGASLNGLALDPWPPNPYAGWVRLFERTHTAFAMAAAALPGARFVIKPKWGAHWTTRIRQAIASRGLNPDLPNLEITTAIGAGELIEQSSVVIGFTSTTLLEAGLAGRPILIPDFEEALDPYFRRHLKLTEIYPYCRIATSPEELVELIKDHLLRPRPLPAEAQAAMERFFAAYVSSVAEDPLTKAGVILRDAMTRGGGASERPTSILAHPETVDFGPGRT